MKKRTFILIDASVLLLMLGLIYAYSVIMAPLVKEFSWSPPQLSLIYALSIISFIVGNIISGQMLKHMTVKQVFFYGAMMIVGGFIVSAFANSPYDLILIYIFYGVIASAGIGFIYNSTLPTITAWYPDKESLAQGTLLMIYGLGAFILGPVIAQIYTTFNWRPIFIILGILFGLLIVLSSFLISKPKKEDVVKLKAKKSQTLITKDKDLHDMFHDPIFYLFYLWMILLGVVGQGILGIGKSLPDQHHLSATLAALIAGLVALGNGAGRIIGGWVIQKIGKEKSMIIFNCLLFISVGLLLVSENEDSLIPLSLGCLLAGLSFGSVLLTMVYFTRAVWGLKNMALNFGVVNSYGIPAVFIGSYGSGIIYGISGSYIPVFIIMMVLSFFAFLDLLILNKYLSKESMKIINKKTSPYR